MNSPEPVTVIDIKVALTLRQLDQAQLATERLEHFLSIRPTCGEAYYQISIMGPKQKLICVVEKLLGDPDNIATNLVSYINGFSERALQIFEMFEFETEIEKLDKANRLFLIVREFTNPKFNLHPDHIKNDEMGYVFEELVRKFNEQANEEAGDHFTPREVIHLMANLVYTDEEDVYRPGIVRTIYDPACGTGGMLSVSEEHIKKQNPQAHLELFGQEYNEESWAICCSDLLIKDEPVDNIVFGDTLGDGQSFDGLPIRNSITCWPTPACIA